MNKQLNYTKTSIITVLIIVLFAVLSVITSNGLTAHANDYFGGGDGSINNPYLICSTTHFNNIQHFPSSCFKQMNNINFNNTTPTLYNKTFSGNYNGNNKTISGVFINNQTSTYQGAFCGINTGYISSFTIYSNINTNSNLSGVGGVVGLNSGASFVEYITAQAVITSSGGLVAAMGGIVGENKNEAMVWHCNSNGTMTNNNIYAGGIVGWNVHSTSAISHCISSMNVSTKYYAGGICGYNSGQLYNCTSNGTVSLTTNDNNWAIGGIVGYNKLHVLSCTSNSSVSYTASSSTSRTLNPYLGKVIGYNNTVAANISGSTSTSLSSLNQGTLTVDRKSVV